MKCSDAKNLNLAGAMPGRAVWKGRLCFSYLLPSGDLSETQTRKT